MRRSDAAQRRKNPAVIRRIRSLRVRLGARQQLSEPVRKRLAALGLLTDFYDTGKLLNIFLSELGERLIFRDTTTLCHLGGVSHVREKRQRAAAARAHKLTVLRRKPWQVAPLMYRRACRAWQMRRRPDVFDQSGKLSFSMRRDVYSFYFADVLAALHAGALLPPLPKCGISDLEARIKVVTQQLAEAYQAFRG